MRINTDFTAQMLLFRGSGDMFVSDVSTKIPKNRNIQKDHRTHSTIIILYYIILYYIYIFLFKFKCYFILFYFILFYFIYFILFYFIFN